MNLKRLSKISDASKVDMHPSSKEKLHQTLLVLVEERGPEGDFNDIDTSAITSMSFLFDSPKLRTFNGKIDQWDVSSVESMYGMFEECSSFNQSLDNWDVSNVTNMTNMFAGCKSFNQPLDNWDVSSVIYMSNMFAGCKSFNQPLDNWDVSSVIYMSNMFAGCKSFNQPLDSWDVSSVEYMYGMFEECSSFNQSLDNWDVSKVRFAEDMFKDTKAKIPSWYKEKNNVVRASTSTEDENEEDIADLFTEGYEPPTKAKPYWAIYWAYEASMGGVWSAKTKDEMLKSLSDFPGITVPYHYSGDGEFGLEEYDTLEVGKGTASFNKAIKEFE